MSDQGDQPQLPPQPPPQTELPPPTPTSTSGAPVQTPSSEPSSDARTWGMVAHLSALAGLVLPTVGHIIGPLVVWLVKKDQYPFVDDQGKESLNFQLTVTIAGIIAACLIIVGIGFVLLPLIGLTDLVFVIIASIAANEGKRYRYPFTIRFFK